MEQQNIKFEKFKFDATPYIIPFSEQFQEKGNKNSEFSQLDVTISEKLNECSNINEEMKKIRIENLNMQMELNILKREEEQQSQSSFDLKEGYTLL